MAGNPLIALGSLNKLRGAVIIPTFPNLTITASFLGRQGIGFTQDGESTMMLPAMTGAVTSPEPYVLVTITAHIVRTMALAAAFRSQMETNSLIGQVTVRPDTPSLPQYQFDNCAIENVRELRFAGDDENFIVSMRGTYYLNSAMWG